MKLYRVFVVVNFGGTVIIDEPFDVRSDYAKNARKIAAKDALLKSGKEKKFVSITTNLWKRK